MNLTGQPTTNVATGMTKRRRSRRVMIIGVGQVGMACAYSMVIQNTTDELILVDVNAAKLEGEVMDLSHGVPFGEPTQIIAGDLDTQYDADVVVITAGAKQQPGETRLNLVQRNAEIFQALVPKIMAACPHAIWVVVSNPVDVMTYVSLKLSGLPTARILGSGTALDTARLRALLAQDHNVDARSVHAYIIGEHGDSEVPVWSTANIAGISFKPRFQDEHQQLFEQVKTAAYEIIQRKGATSYAIGLGVNQIVQAILRDQRRVIPVSTQLDGYLDLRDVCLSLPAVLGANGVERVLHLSLSATEQQQFQASARILQETIAQIKW